MIHIKKKTFFISSQPLLSVVRWLISIYWWFADCKALL